MDRQPMTQTNNNYWADMVSYCPLIKIDSPESDQASISHLLLGVIRNDGNRRRQSCVLKE